MPVQTLRLDLALQGGGAHGAFTWGVLERLLEDDEIEVGDVTGTSAGALNGLVLVSGLVAGGRAEASARLQRLWLAVAGLGAPASWLLWPMRKWGSGQWDDYAPVLAPSQTNPVGMQPLAAVLAAVVDNLDDVRAASSHLYVNAVDVQSGQGRLFGPQEMSLAAVLASACAPMMFEPIALDGRFYWDGSYAANPCLEPLYPGRKERDVLLVELAPRAREQVPLTALNILDRINEIASSRQLTQELAAIGRKNLDVRRGHVRVHAIQLAHSDARASDPSGKRSAHADALLSLRDSGRKACEQWLTSHRSSLGIRSTLHLQDGAADS